MGFKPIPTLNVNGTSQLHVFGTVFASTGLTEEAAAQKSIAVKSITVKERTKPEFMTEAGYVTCKLVFNSHPGM